MRQVLHGSATTAGAVRRAIQRIEESVRSLSRRYSISPTIVQKWPKRATVTNRPMGLTAPHSSVLGIDQEAVIVAFRRHSLLPLDDCLYALQPAIPHSSARRCIAAFSGMGYRDCPTSKAICLQRRNSKPSPSGSFTST